jgi:hypothetical protein
LAERSHGLGSYIELVVSGVDLRRVGNGDKLQVCAFPIAITICIVIVVAGLGFA